MINTKIAIVGLGYVGLPLAIEFGKLFETIGFDIKESRIQELLTGKDLFEFKIELTNKDTYKEKYGVCIYSFGK